MSHNSHTSSLLSIVAKEVNEDPYLSETFLPRLIAQDSFTEVVQALQSMCNESSNGYVVPLGVRTRHPREIAAERLLREIQPQLHTWMLSQVV